MAGGGVSGGDWAVQIEQFYQSPYQQQQMQTMNKQGLPRTATSSTPFRYDPHQPAQMPTAPQAPFLILRLTPENLNQSIEILGWRFKTSLPIVKPLQYQILPPAGYQAVGGRQGYPAESQKSIARGVQSKEACVKMLQWIDQHPQVEMVEVAVRLQEMRLRLRDVRMLACSQMVYLLKEMMIGYEVLFDIFGAFEPTDQMVMVDGRDQWRVWISADFAANVKEDTESAQMTEGEFIHKLVDIAEPHAASNSNTKKLLAELRAYTKEQECTFITTIEKIKQFALVNKIFTVNKVAMPLPKRDRAAIGMQKPTTPNKSPDMVSPYPQGQPVSPFRTTLQRRESTNNNNRSMTNIMSAAYTTMPHSPNGGGLPQFGGMLPQHPRHTIQYTQPQQPMAPIHPLKQVSQFISPVHRQAPPPRLEKGKFSNPFADYSGMSQHNTMKYTPPAFKNTVSPPPRMDAPVSQHTPQPRNKFPVSSMSNIHPPPDKPQSHIRPSGSPAPVSPKPSTPKPAQVQPKPQPKPQIQVPAPSQPQSPPAVNYCQTPQMKRTTMVAQPKKGKPRKYSEQLFKVKSLDALTGKKISQKPSIQQNDPQAKKGMKVSKEPSTPKQSNTHIQINIHNATSLQDLTMGPQEKGSENQCVSPNNSSSTHQVRGSSEDAKGSHGQEYHSLKINDLNADKHRNNQSSYYGMGHLKPEAPAKNMATSYEFTNVNNKQADNKSDEEGRPRGGGSNHKSSWNNKLSGLFSDNASIKQLKASVKIKTKEEERFQKEYLKDVKLDMLEKFGRQVRYSIADDDDDFETPRMGQGHIPRKDHEHYKSMQLIEQVFDDQGKSYMMEPEERKIEDVATSDVRTRNRTAFIQPTKASFNEVAAGGGRTARECHSEYDSASKDSQKPSEEDDCFNFNTEMYSLNPLNRKPTL